MERTARHVFTPEKALHATLFPKKKISTTTDLLSSMDLLLLRKKTWLSKASMEALNHHY
jgi:hypothetical protein